MIFSDSTCKPIDMVKFEKELNDNIAVKRFFGGATASQMDYYARPHLKDELPDRVIIHVGTNNLTKKRYQTEKEVVDEIFTIVNYTRRDQ